MCLSEKVLTACRQGHDDMKCYVQLSDRQIQHRPFFLNMHTELGYAALPGLKFVIVIMNSASKKFRDAYLVWY